MVEKLSGPVSLLCSSPLCLHRYGDEAHGGPPPTNTNAQNIIIHITLSGRSFLEAQKHKHTDQSHVSACMVKYVNESHTIRDLRQTADKK